MKTTTLLLGIAIGTSQITSLVCMDQTNFLSIERKEGEAQLVRYTYTDFSIEHFDLRIGVDPNKPYDITEILADLFTQQKRVSLITTTNSDFSEVVENENTALIQLRDDFFAKLTKYKADDAETMQEVEENEDPINWIMGLETQYRTKVKSRLLAFANMHNRSR